uniref:ATP synthase F0 subunit 8 n=1 Tax=Calinaga buddha TaxID=191405 RepID=UPI002551D2EC|nr:ATP synthase F0 subunit 8 [Calinaga buddha]WGU20172.1 ATP synthase F0 subunit 8 [Calinaga buddha]
MPQMMPINWLFSLFFFLFIFILFNIINYFIFNYKYLNNSNKINLKNNFFSWKW